MASQHIVGVHVAMFTGAEVLSSAAFIEFRRQVDALLVWGERAGALRLWGSVVLFEHMPPSTRPGDGPAGFPSMRISVFPKSVRPRCDQGRGGYAFPWVGIWNRRGTIVPSGFTPQQAWDRHARLDASMDLLLLQPYRTPYSADNFVPSYLWEFMQKVPGDLDLLPLQTFQSEVLYYMRRWILGSPHGLWSNPFRAPLPDIEHLPRIWTPFARRFVPIEPFVDGWGPQSTERQSFLRHVAAVVIPLIGSALVVSRECAPPVSQCSKSVRPAANFRRLMTIVGNSVGAQAMAYRAQVAEAVEAPVDDPASSVGWRAEDSLARVAGARAITWRRERGYEKDEDFAFAFSTWEEAVAVGGHFLADAWLAVRVAQQEELLPAAARLIEGGPPVPDRHVLRSLGRGRKLHLRRGYASTSGCRISPSRSSARSWLYRRCS